MCEGCVSFVFGPCYVLQCLVSFSKEESAGCFSFIVFWTFVILNVLQLFLTVPRVGLQFVILAFPDHTHLLARSLVVY